MMRKSRQKSEENKGFTLIEVIIVVAIFATLLGIMIPSLNSVLGFHVRRTTESICSALDRTKSEAMNRLVAEVKLSYVAGDGYYITYYLDRGKDGGSDEKVRDDQAEKIAPAKTRISYTDDSGVVHNMWQSGNTSLILTYNRATGGFRQIQTETIGQEQILDQLDQGKDVAFHDSGSYCRSITIAGGGSTKRIDLNKEAGTYTVVNVKTGQ